jgi:NADH:ubiquinone oxidoreductase subunit C
MDIRIDDNTHLVREVQGLHEEDARLITITGIDLGDAIELVYHFDREGIVNLRMMVDEDKEIPSISDTYFYAKLYEREVSEMFNLRIKGAEGGLLLSESLLGRAPLRKRFKVEEVVLVKSGKKEG